MIVREGNLSPREAKAPVGHIVPESSTPDGEHKAVFFPYSGDISVTVELSHFVGNAEKVIAAGYQVSAMDSYPLPLVLSHQPAPHLPVAPFVFEEVLVEIFPMGQG